MSEQRIPDWWKKNK